jgi:membrane peptidoglycan carboxypeptidase
MKRINAYLVTKARRQRRTHITRVRSGIIGKASWGLAALLVCVIGGLVILAGWQYAQLTRDLPSIDQIPTQLNAQSPAFTRPTRLIDRTGTQVIYDLSMPGVQRKYIRLEGVGETVSKDFSNALVALLEPNFWSTSGVDFSTMSPDDHGSIAQLLVYHMLLSNEEPDTRRALREKILAYQVVSTYGRERVLEWYINSVSFGPLAYGVEAASQLYLGKSSTTVNLPEAALLAGVAVAPALNPWDSPAGAKTVQVEALKALSLQKIISTDQLRSALSVQLEFAPKVDIYATSASILSEQVVAELEPILGRERVERGGLIIQTTIDADLQANLECTILAQLKSLEGDQQAILNASRSCTAARLLPLLPPADQIESGSLAASGMVSNPQTGEVLASSGEIVSLLQTNLSTSHQAGTILTPFIYLNGFSQGLSPATLVWDAPSTISSRDGELLNIDGSFHGPVRTRIALANDYLTPLNTLLKQTGSYSLARLASSLGIPLKQTENASQLLETPVTLAQLTQAYNILAASGNRYGQIPGMNETPSLYFVQNVYSEDGKSIYSAGDPKQFGVVSSQLAYLLNNTLSDDLARRPTQGSAGVLQLGIPTAAKLGQSLDGNQAWTAGYSPDRTVLIWMGYSQDPKASTRVDSHWSAGIWRALMETASEGLPSRGFDQPAGLTRLKVCDPSGLLPSTDCPSTVDEVFITGNEPFVQDTYYRKLSINNETGLLATVFTPASLVVEKVFQSIPTEYQSWAKQVGLELPPSRYDSLQAGSPDPAAHITSPEMFDAIHGKIEIIGTASANEYASYQLQVGEGLNPRDWVQIGSGTGNPIVEGELAEWDTSGLNGLYVIRLQVVDANNVIRTGLQQVTVDNTPPQIKLEFPAANADFSLQDASEMFIKANLDGVSDLKQADVLIDGQVVGQLNSNGNYYNWKMIAGTHTIQLQATDFAGNTSLTQPIEITVQ